MAIWSKNIRKHKQDHDDKQGDLESFQVILEQSFY